MKYLKFYILFFLIACNTSKKKEVDSKIKEDFSKNSTIRIEPPFWYVNFKEKSLQLLVKEDSISFSEPSILYDGISIKNIHKADSNNYLFIDLEIEENTNPGKFYIDFRFKNGAIKRHHYELKSRIKKSNDYKGFDSSDVIYLITPDRFANSDPSNDINLNLKEIEIDRNDGYKRHGGDIKGITNHLDYLKDLGFTSIWPTPLLINDMPKGSYHGYAMTDYYKVDPRFGSLNDYKNLADELRKRDMKLIMDQVANHCGLEHWWMKDLPFKDWINDQQHYELNKYKWSWKTVNGSNHRRTTNQDIYASNIDKKGNNEGWFVETMPDLNQRNPFLAKYIIQNSIWWIETLGLSGIRQDTYPYPDKQFMSNWAGAIMNEYPNFSIVGEEWSYNPLLVGYWQNGAKNKDGYKSNLKSTMDFPMQKSIIDGINEEENWNTGLIKLYEGLANDFHYASPKDIMIFLDNHDKSRLYTEVNEDIVKSKMALSYMLVLPRIPQIFYGTEILMDDSENPGDHGLIRTDFPGGWKNDNVDAFSGKGLSENQKSMQSFTKKLLNYRKTSEAIHKGETIHFAPLDGIYFLFRIYKDETVVHIINKNENTKIVDLDRFAEVGLNGKTLKNIISGELFKWENSIELKEKGSLILTTKF